MTSSETQGDLCREAVAEGSVERNLEPMNKNRMVGVTDGTSGQLTAKFKRPNVRVVDPAVVRGKMCFLPGEISRINSERNTGCLQQTKAAGREKSAKAVVVLNVMDEGPNGNESNRP